MIKRYCPIEASPNSELGELHRINLEIERKKISRENIINILEDRYGHLILFYWDERKD